MYLQINIGVLQKNEQYNEDMTDICTFLNKYVPGVSEVDEDWQKKPVKTLTVGDYLTFERHKQAQSAKRNGRTPSKRLEGLIPKLEEFPNQAEFLQVKQFFRVGASLKKSVKICLLFLIKNRNKKLVISIG